MNIDIANDLFSIPDFVSKALYNGVELEHGAIVSKRFDQGRPGVAGEFRPQIREGAGNHSTIYLHAKEEVFKANGSPKVGDAIRIAEELGAFQDYKVRGTKGAKGGFYEILAETVGSRIMNTDKGTAKGVRRISE